MIIQSITMACKSIFANKMRSFLTVLGIIIGIIAVIVLISLGQGATSTITSSIESLGTNLLTVSVRTGRDNPLTLDKLTRDLLDEDCIGDFAPTISMSATAKAGTKTYTDGSMIGTTPPYETVRNQYTQAGRFITQPDIDNRTYAAVIGTKVAEELWGTTTGVVGETINLNGYAFTVVGILEEKGSSMMGSQDNQIIIPFTLAQRMNGQPRVQSFYAVASSSDRVNETEAFLTAYLDDIFPDADGSSNPNYTIFNQSSMLDTLNEATATLSLMLGGIAAISLLVGGIGIMNMMLVSVSERTREIGIRKSIGATRTNILIQFLIEALVLSLMGGVLGLIISALMLGAISGAMGMALSISLGVAEMALGFSLFIGVVFGIYPANQAAKLRPIDALRYNG